MTTATAQKLSEKTYSEKPLTVDLEAGIIRGVKCLGESSLNHRSYSLQARQDCAKLYEGMDVNLDHAAEAGGDRTMSEGFGVLRNTHVSEVDGAVYGDLHYLKAHPLAAMIAERAEKMPRNFGLSHDAIGDLTEGADGDDDIVESIIEVNSVDIVRRPATNAGLFESTQRKPVMPKTTKSTLRKTLEANKTDKRAVNLLALMEQSDEFAAMAEAPVEMAAESSGDDQVKAAFRAMVIAAFDDEALDTKATMARIKEIMNAQDKLNKKPEAPVPAEGDVEVPALESLTKRLDQWDHRQLIADVMEDAGLSRTDLDPSQRKLLERQTSEDDMRAIIEGLDIQPANNGGGAKPRIPVKINESTSESYDDLLVEARRNSTRRQKRA